MKMHISRKMLASAACSVSALALSMGTADAQTETPPPAPEASSSQPQEAQADASVADIVVTGYRASLESAARSKRDAINFTESVNASDIGKFPDLNLAESLQRVPGVQISRDLSSGEGTQVRVRGLGPSFTRVVLNGTPINPATDGGIDDNSNGREVDLNLFPSELFTKLEISKSAQPEQLEGGLSLVNLRPAHAFDKPGQHMYLAANSSYSTSARKAGYGASLIYSNTWDNFGILIGAVGNVRRYSNDAYWSSGWTNANLNCAGCDNTQSNQFTFATSVPANSGNGLVAGTPITLNTLLALNPGLTGNQLTNAYLPRADRHEYLSGTTKRGTGLVSLEWRPSDSLRFTVDAMGNKTRNVFDRYNSNWYVRSSAPATTGGMVPINVKVDENNVVTSGTFANSNFFVTQRHTVDRSYFYHVNPSVFWNPADNLEIDLSGYYSQAELKRSIPTLWITTRLNQGITANYSYGADQKVPTVSFNFDVANPTSGIWTWENETVQREERTTDSKGARLNFRYDVDPDFRVSFGGAYDQSKRSILAYSADATAALRSQIPQDQIANYLTTITPRGIPNRGYTTYTVVDREKLLAATNLEELEANAPLRTLTALGTSIGDVEEKVKGAYLQFSGTTQIFDRDLRISGGVRYTATDQIVSGPIQLGTVISFQDIETNYDAWLPSLNLSYEPMDNLIVRGAVSRTMTRANPQQILPGTVITDATVQNARAGNPELKPYFSDNYDLGLEYYFSQSGYVALGGFTKKVTGFPTTQFTNAIFGDLGIPISALLAFQQDAVNANGGLNAPIIISRPVNTDVVKLKGLEATWVQPLDFLFKGIGFNASFTYVDDGDTNVVTAIAPRIYNLIGYYENDNLSLRVSWVRQASRVVAGAPTNGFVNAVQREQARSQVDVSARYKFELMGKALQLSLDGTNILEAKTLTSQDDGITSLPLRLHNPGAQYRLELSMSF
ncbi:TonB-dependent receptor [Sphingobium algorifonticola]|uniref:TonB-dependent receptor n=1 Tax=Sphingobium algorifonticola TaxID=2008318 RepID=A0A437JC55_9SPHN|nr:TonB-dependent receptor [Sphingobium algorifonticola]RVT43465.1 TonB-dependent receptor [Sphingobium algorifonticola]